MARKSLRNRRRRQKRNQNTRKRNKKQARKTIRRRKGGTSSNKQTNEETFEEMCEGMWNRLENYMDKSINSDSITGYDSKIKLLLDKKTEKDAIETVLQEKLLNDNINKLWYYNEVFMMEIVKKYPYVMRIVPEFFWNHSEFKLKEVNLTNFNVKNKNSGNTGVTVNLISIFVENNNYNEREIAEFYDWLKRRIIDRVIDSNIRSMYDMFMNQYQGYCPLRDFTSERKSIRARRPPQDITDSQMRIYNGLEVQPTVMPHWHGRQGQDKTAPDPFYNTKKFQPFEIDHLRCQYPYRDAVEDIYYKYYRHQSFYNEKDYSLISEKDYKYLWDKDLVKYLKYYKKYRTHSEIAEIDKMKGENKDLVENTFIKIGWGYDMEKYENYQKYGFEWRKASLLRYNICFVYKAFEKLGGYDNFNTDTRRMSELGFQPVDSDDPSIKWVKRFINCCILNTIYYKRNPMKAFPRDNCRYQTILKLLDQIPDFKRVISALNLDIQKNNYSKFIKLQECRDINTRKIK